MLTSMKVSDSKDSSAFSMSQMHAPSEDSGFPQGMRMVGVGQEMLSELLILSVSIASGPAMRRTATALASTAHEKRPSVDVYRPFGPAL